MPPYKGGGAYSLSHSLLFGLDTTLESSQFIPIPFQTHDPGESLNQKAYPPSSRT